MKSQRPCPRCGVWRGVRLATEVKLCADCRLVLSEQERSLWAS